MRFTHERYILTLLVDRLPLTEIRNALVALALPIPSQQELVRIEAWMVDEAGPDLASYLLNPKKTLANNKRKFLAELIVKLKLGPYFRQTYDFNKIVLARQNKDVRAVIEGLVLSVMPDEELVTLINERFELNFSKEDLVAYKQFFFELSWMEMESWHFHLSKCEPEEAKIKVAAMRMPMNLAYLKWRAGFPVNIGYMDQLEKLKTDCSFQLEEMMNSPQMDVAKANVLSAIMMRAGDRIEKYKKPDDLSALDRLKLEFMTVEALKSIPARMNIGPLPEIKRLPQQTTLVSVPNGKSDGESQ